MEADAALFSMTVLLVQIIPCLLIWIINCVEWLIVLTCGR